jgi:choline dehydrogenase
MKLVLSSLVGLSSCLTAVLAVAPFPYGQKPRRSWINESLNAEELIGSHFGMIDIAQSYDYIVVGGGTAGLTIARRLAEHNTVAVIEAGGFYELDNSNLTEIPADASYYLGKNPLFRNPLLDWQQITTPQPGFQGVEALYPSGHTLGGGSTRNFMWYQRGSAGSYQKWAEAVGDDSYLFENFETYFKKSIQFTPPSPQRLANSTPQYDPTAFDPQGGPLQVGYPVFASPSASWLAKGMEAIGMKEINGMHNGNLFGWTWIANTIDPTQKRSTSESSFLRDAIQNTLSLQVYQNTLAKRVIFNSNKTATGVEVESTGVGSGSLTYTLSANKEVILSSGAFRSPQMLMVSGVGPAATLQQHGIPVVADRPGVVSRILYIVYLSISAD